MKTILVTGGCGFLGSWVVHHLLSNGYKVKIFDNRFETTMLEFANTGFADRQASEQVEFIKGDITNIESVQNATVNCHAIVHLAGLLTVDCESNPVLGAQVNVMGCINVFNAAIKGNISKVIYLSSAGVYGPDSGVVPHPPSHYGTFKLANEGCARAFAKSHQIASVGLRPYIIYGAGASSGLSAGASRACLAAYNDQPFEIGFSGDVGFVYVEDVANSIVASLENNFSGAHTFNLSGENNSVGHFIETLKQKFPTSEISVNGEPFQIAPSLEETKTVGFLADLPVTSIGQGITKTINHYQNNQTTTIN